MSSDEIKNAKITGTMLGVEDHGIFSSMIYLSGDGWGIGFGGYAPDEPVKDGDGKFLGRRGSAYGAEFLRRVLETLEAASWEKLPGTVVRVRLEGGWGGTAAAIGHAIKDQWFEPRALAKEMIP